MRGVLARAPWAAILLVWLFLAFQSDAAPKDTANMYAHAYERLWLWERYSMAVDMQTKGTDGKIIDQNEILPIRKQRGGGEGYKNQHWDQETDTRGGPLHYNEFMQRLSGVPTDEAHIPPKITAPSGVDDLERAAQELIDNRLTGNLQVNQINESFGRTGGGKKGKRPVNTGTSREDAMSREDGRYQSLMSALDEQLRKWRADETNYDKIKDHDRLMKPLTDRVVQLRIEDGRRFMVNHFSRNDGLDLKDKMVTHPERSDVPGGPDYERIDLGQTWENHKSDIKQAIARVTDGKVKIKSFRDFESWVTDFGNPNGRFATETKANPSHFKTLQMWRNIDAHNPCS